MAFLEVPYLPIQYLVAHFVIAFITVSFSIIIYNKSFSLIKRKLYLDDFYSLIDINSPFKIKLEYSKKTNTVYNIMINEVRLILRNKRSKSALIISLMAFVFGFIVYRSSGANEVLKIIMGMMITGVFITNYGQFMYGWQASYFNGLMASKMTASSFLSSKYLLFTVISTIAFILNIPFVYFGFRTLLIHFVMLLWNIGVNTILVLFFANRNYKGIDLSIDTSFSTAGESKWLLIFPLIILPFIVYAPITLITNEDVGLLSLAIVGIIFILSRKFFLGKLEVDFSNNKYAILKGFENK